MTMSDFNDRAQRMSSLCTGTDAAKDTPIEAPSRKPSLKDYNDDDDDDDDESCLQQFLSKFQQVIPCFEEEPDCNQRLRYLPRTRSLDSIVMSFSRRIDLPVERPERKVSFASCKDSNNDPVREAITNYDREDGAYSNCPSSSDIPLQRPERKLSEKSAHVLHFS
jgi:hypothetical protein